MKAHQPGCKAKPQQVLALPDDMCGGAEFSADRAYRYLLWRRWGVGPQVTWVMLNPSTADEVALDPTVSRCVGFARMWGAGGVEIVNLFALRATKPVELTRCSSPVGERNDDAILNSAKAASIIVVAWGVGGALHNRASDVCNLLVRAGIRLQCLGTTKAGEPRHPLYLRSNSSLVAYDRPQPKAKQ